jgi:osmotically inducible protein OsmC
MAGPAKSTAHAVWEGNLVQGSGRFSLDSGVLKDQPVTWAARTERTPGTTSPEELIAAAHAACYAMAFSHSLATKGTPSSRLEVTAICTFAPKQGGGWEIAAMDLRVRGTVPGLDQAAFAQAAKEGEQGCPVSNALRGSVKISLTAELA